VDLPCSLDGIQAPERVLQWRVSSIGTDVVLQILIKWSDLHWLPRRTIKPFVNAFCVHLLVDKQVLNGEGMLLVLNTQALKLNMNWQTL
jgi:hypothetical protein